MSQAEEEFAFQLKAVGLKGWVREHQFDRLVGPCGFCMYGQVAGKRKALIKCKRCNGTGTREEGRKWAFDFAWVKEKVAVEIEGGVYVKGRHTRGAAFEEDCVKYSTATCAGWTVLRVTPKHVTNGEALKWAESLLGKS